LAGKRKRWSSKVAGDANETLTEIVEAILLDLSIKAGLNKVGYKYLRSQAVAALDNGDHLAIKTAFSAISKLALTGVNRNHKEIIEQRSWLMRQIVKHPIHYPVFMFCGHFCVYSSNYRDAAAEYLRAIHMEKKNPFPYLCMSSSLLSVSVSRMTKDKNSKILEAIAIYHEYRRLRVEQYPGDEFILAETLYNGGRALHQVSMVATAESQYLKCLDILDRLHDHRSRQLAIRCAYALGLMYQRNGNVRGAAAVLKQYLAF
jgi:hypothetical protein